MRTFTWQTDLSWTSSSNVESTIDASVTNRRGWGRADFIDLRTLSGQAGKRSYHDRNRSAGDDIGVITVYAGECGPRAILGQQASGYPITFVGGEI
ncbi:hypothetical protein QD460_31005 [Rhizobium jaguaris]|uniref:Uncharacterized protein n=1 Tax=Rhizobium jaguaris TaxID=1312183 RepID=A0A387G345_9HYPH|nr:hypothetical protein [Rhizobium jaguaris]AYG62432.1 hypothetical protein CCGE525_27005 [Rhizobium jaguaris]